MAAWRLCIPPQLYIRHTCTKGRKFGSSVHFQPHWGSPVAQDLLEDFFFFFNYSCLHCLSLPVGCVDLLTLRLSEKKPLMFCYQGAPSPKGSDLPAPWWAVTTLACGMLIIFNCCCVSSHIRLHQMTEWDVTDRRQSSVIPANPPPPPSPEPFAFTVWIYQPSVKSFQRIKAALMVWPQWRHQLPVISKSPVQQELRA